jgi:hypothetical protein
MTVSAHAHNAVCVFLSVCLETMRAARSLEGRGYLRFEASASQRNNALGGSVGQRNVITTSGLIGLGGSSLASACYDATSLGGVDDEESGFMRLA